ncbi:MAG: HAD family hydrolase [Sedimentisphaerales bacterium]|nr:HAD family hydrolase [Sedimentisphaerales bacterium]
MSALATVRAVVFDLDDTLYPEVDYVRSGFQCVANHLAKGEWTADGIFELLWSAFSQGPKDRVFNTVLEQLGRDDNSETIAGLVALYREHCPQLQLAPETIDILDQLKQDYRLGLLSDGFLPAQQLKVEALGLGKWFDKIIFTEQLGREFWKPATKAFEMMSDALGCPPESCVYVADNVSKDFIGPNQLGWQSIRLINERQVHSDIAPVPGGEPGFVIRKLSELIYLLKS